MGLSPNKLPILNSTKIFQKRKLVFWVVSNCETRSKREGWFKKVFHTPIFEVESFLGPPTLTGHLDL